MAAPESIVSRTLTILSFLSFVSANADAEPTGRATPVCHGTLPGFISVSLERMTRPLLFLVAIGALLAVPYCAWPVLVVAAATGAIRGTTNADKLLPAWNAEGQIWLFALLFSLIVSFLSFHFALRRPHSDACTTQ